MRTKTFFHLNLGWQLLSAFPFVVAIMSGYGVVRALIDGIYILLLLLIPLIVFSYLFLQCEHNRIVLKKEYIFAPDDWLSKRQKIQYKTIIRYDEIKEINLIKTNKNSLGKSIKILSPAFSLTFIEFKCEDGSNKRLFVFYITKRQRIKIINEIKERMKAVGNEAIIPNAIEIIENLNKANNGEKS